MMTLRHLGVDMTSDQKGQGRGVGKWVHRRDGLLSLNAYLSYLRASIAVAGSACKEFRAINPKVILQGDRLGIRLNLL